MTDIINFFTQNWNTIATVAGVVLSIASVVTGLTSTPVDDSIVAFLQKLLGRFSVVTNKDAPGTFKLPGASASGPILQERASLGSDTPKGPTPL